MLKNCRVPSTFGRWGRQNMYETVARAWFPLENVKNLGVSGHYWKMIRWFIDSFIRSFVRSFIHFTNFISFHSISFHSFIHSLIHAIPFNSIQLKSIQFNHSSIFFTSFIQFTSFQLTNNSYKQTGSYSHALFSKLPPRRVPSTTWNKHTHTYIHTYIHACIHTYMHTYIYQ